MSIIFFTNYFCTVLRMDNGTSVLASTFFFHLQGVDLYIKLLSKVSDDSIKYGLQTELLSLLSKLPSLTHNQEQLVSNISCLTALTDFFL